MNTILWENVTTMPAVNSARAEVKTYNITIDDGVLSPLFPCNHMYEINRYLVILYLLLWTLVVSFYMLIPYDIVRPGLKYILIGYLLVGLLNFKSIKLFVKANIIFNVLVAAYLCLLYFM